MASHVATRFGRRLALRISVVVLAVPAALSALGSERERRDLKPLLSTNRPVEMVGPIRSGIERVKVPDISFEETNDRLTVRPSEIFSSRLGPESRLNRGTPSPVTRWEAAANIAKGMIDPQVAVSDTVVAVLTWDRLAFYDKAGVLLPATGSFPNPTDTETIFAPVVALLDQKLNLDPGVAGDPSFLLANGSVGDARVAFDPHRKRFIVVATAKNKPDGDKNPSSLVISQRRTKFLLAVSISEDPADGFFTWGGNGTPDDGACSQVSDAAPCPGSDFVPGDAGDYPTIGISRAHYVITDHVEHEGVFDGSPSFSKTAYIVTVNAADAAAGHADIHGHAFWFFDDPSTGAVATGVIGPAIQHDKVLPEETNFLIQVIYGSNQLSLYAVSASDPPTLHATSFTLGDNVGDPIDAPQPSSLSLNYDHGTHVVTAYLRGAGLVGTTTDCVHWSDMASGRCADAIHVLKLVVTSDFAVLADQAVFGERNPFTDPPNAVNWYANPGVAVNKDGDLVTTYNRTGRSLPPEVRYSAWFHDEDEPRVSAILRKGTGTEPDDYRDDTAGIAVDPFDDTAIWMTHTYAAGDEKLGLVVGKVFGRTHPDLAVSDLMLSRERALLHSGFTVTNHGDRAAPSAQAEISLVCDVGVARSLDTVTVPPLGPGASEQFNETVTLGPLPLPALCHVRVKVEPDTPVREYSTTNNVASRPFVGQ